MRRSILGVAVARDGRQAEPVSGGTVTSSEPLVCTPNATRTAGPIAWMQLFGQFHGSDDGLMTTHSSQPAS
jgi:hypothetical protein